MALSDTYKLNGNSFTDVGQNLSSKYAGYNGYLDAYHSLANQQSSLGSSDRAGLVQRLDNLVNTFSGQFQNYVGRAPTQAETESFLQGPAAGEITNSPYGRSENNGTQISNDVTGYIGNNFQQAAKDYATQQLTAQQGQARDLANQYRTLGNQALDSTSQYLQNYQQQLFNRLQPQIITSLQSQGLLNTGGLNEAMAGAQKDLASQAQGYLADANLQMQNQANAIQFGGAAAPYQYQQSNYLNQVPYLQQAGSTALSNGYNTFMQQLQYQDQLGLQNNFFQNQRDMAPSMLSTLGQSFASSFGKSAGDMSAQMPFAGLQAYGQGSSKQMGAAMLA